MRMISGHKQRVNRMSKWFEANPRCFEWGGFGLNEFVRSEQRRIYPHRFACVPDWSAWWTPFAVGWVTRRPAWHGWSSTWICPASKCPGSAMLFVTAFKCRRFTCPIWDADARDWPRSRSSSRRGLCSRSIWPEVGAPRTRIRPALESVWVKPCLVLFYFSSVLFICLFFCFVFFFFLLLTIRSHSQLLLHTVVNRCKSWNSKNSGNAYSVERFVSSVSFNFQHSTVRLHKLRQTERIDKTRNIKKKKK